MTKQRNNWYVIIYDGETRVKHPPVSTDEKAKKFLQTLDVRGFIYYGDVMYFQYVPAIKISTGKIIREARWVER